MITHLHRLRYVYDISMLLLSLYVVVVLALSIVADWPESTQILLDAIDLLICAIFLADWFYFLARSKHKRAYVRSRALDLIASIPFVAFLRAFRVVRTIRLLRTLRLLGGLRGALPLIRHVAGNKRRSTLVIYSFSCLVILVYCAVGLYHFERDGNPQMHSFEDALWLAFSTLTVSGYGEIYPVTSGGRILSAVLTLAGLGLFSLVTAEIASLFLRYLKDEREDHGQRDRTG